MEKLAFKQFTPNNHVTIKHYYANKGYFTNDAFMHTAINGNNDSSTVAKMPIFKMSLQREQSMISPTLGGSKCFILWHDGQMQLIIGAKGPISFHACSVMPQYHCCFDDLFETTHYNQSNIMMSATWKQFVELCSADSTPATREPLEIFAEPLGILEEWPNAAQNNPYASKNFDYFLNILEFPQQQVHPMTPTILRTWQRIPCKILIELFPPTWDCPVQVQLTL